MKKTAIVTGGCRGIGFAVAKKLAEENCDLSLFSSGGEEKYAEKIDELRSLGASVLYVSGALENAEDRSRLIEETVKRFGRIDVLVNNAGVAPQRRLDLLEMTEESFDRVMGINARGTVFLPQLAARQMIAQPRVFRHKGHVVNIGSCSAAVSSVSRAEYCISKAAVSMATVLFADRLAGEDILVNEIRPGVIATDMTAAVREKYDRMFEDGVFPIARWGAPEDVAEMAAFFCSDAVGYTTGNYVDVDGGFHIKRL